MADKDVRFDYDKQAWVQNGRYVRCGHPEAMDCRCYGRAHEGERAAAPDEDSRLEQEG